MRGAASRDDETLDETREETQDEKWERALGVVDFASCAVLPVSRCVLISVWHHLILALPWIALLCFASAHYGSASQLGYLGFQLTRTPLLCHGGRHNATRELSDDVV